MTTFTIEYTRPDGAIGTAGERRSKYVAAIAVTSVFATDGIQVPVDNAKAFIKRMNNEPCGTPVLHGPSGYTFVIVQTEES
jgi:hypothetical protein